MVAGQLEGILRQVREGALRKHGIPDGDAELLERFLACRDEAAFEQILRRHGPMILGVCRRVTANAADAEDAFQATFVVLLRKAHSIHPRAKLANWLYGVAHKTALKAKAMNTKRRIKEKQAAQQSKGDYAAENWASVLNILDTELAVLPKKYRTAIVLCDLEGLSYREAAARLGCAQGTLSGRLTRGRILLARRMGKHGLAFSAGVLATLVAHQASAAVPPALRTMTLRALCIQGGSLAGSGLSPKVLSLAEGVVRMMILMKLKVITGTVSLLVLALSMATLGLAQVAGSGGPSKPTTASEPQPAETGQVTTDKLAAPKEARFTVEAVDQPKRTITVLVAGTKAPILTLPLHENVQVKLDKEQADLTSLRKGMGLTLTMDSTHTAVKEIRAVTEEVIAHARPPSAATVIRALPPVPKSIPPLYEVRRDDIKIASERIVARLDEPRMFPQIGQARLLHCQWKCTVYFKETVQSSYPYPFCNSKPRVEVVYIDMDRLMGLAECE
jgi:RNA polymerase sigma factor (sigma-70 family)